MRSSIFLSLVAAVALSACEHPNNCISLASIVSEWHDQIESKHIDCGSSNIVGEDKAANIALCLLESAAECSVAKGDLLVIADDAEAHPVLRHFFVQDDCSVVIVAATNLEYATVSTCAGLQREESHPLINGTDCHEDMTIEFTCH